MLIFLKLGGSLITDKSRSHTANDAIIRRIAGEIVKAKRALPDLQLVIGHGSGSFGHIPASQFGTRQGVSDTRQWAGFVEVWRQARDLNEIVLTLLYQAGLPVMAFPPSVILQSNGGKVQSLYIDPLRSALAAGLIPVVNGDVIFDTHKGGTIFSTEDVFLALADQLHPDQVLIAGLEPGVWEDFPQCTRILPRLTPEMEIAALAGVGGSSSIDVTGGMAEKVKLMLLLIENNPTVHAVIFSGLPQGSIFDSLQGRYSGTIITQTTGGV